jgi:hypothetical protein
MLPSRVGFDRVSRVRAIRRVLAAHRMQTTIRVTGCECGWRPPTYVTDGHASFEAHLADRIAGAL